MQNRKTVPKFLSAIALAALIPALATAAKKPPPSWDGLDYRPTKGLDAVYVRTGADFKAYRTVLLDPVEVEFDRNWKPNSTGMNRVSSADMQKIRDNMASDFRKVFTEELAAGGYQVVEQAGEDTLRVSAALVDVYINAPDTMTPGRSYTYTMNAGQVTLVTEMRDGPTGQLLARVVDKKAGTDTGSLQVSSSVSNSAEFRRAVRSWAKRLRTGLDKVNGRG
jgi:hypothetical protein